MIFCLQKLALGLLAVSLLAASPALAQEPSDGANMQFNFDAEEFSNFGEEGFDNGLTPEQEAAASAIGMGLIIGYFCFIGVMLLLQIYVAYLLYDALSAVPEQYRELEPWVPWLLFVPLANLVVIFLAFIKTPRSLAKCLAASGDTSHADCGESLGLWGAVLTVLGCTSPIGLILLIMSLLKINKAKQAVRQLPA